MFLLKTDDAPRAALVEQLKRDPTSPARWLALLQHPPSYDAKLYSKVRLFRRATTLLSKDHCRNDRSYVELLILFAKLKGCDCAACSCGRRTLELLTDGWTNGANGP